MNESSNIRELVKSLGLDVDPTDREAVIRALRCRLATLHPDRTAGEFQSEEAKRTFHETQEALTAVEAAEPTALVPLRDVTSLVESLAKSVAPILAAQEESHRTQRSREIRERVRAHHYSFKITSGTLLGVSSGLFAFMGALEDHPVFGYLSYSIWSHFILPMIWLYSVLFFGIAWLGERRAESYAEFLTTDKGLSHTFARLCHYGLEALPTGGRGFARHHLVEAILGQGGHRSMLMRIVAFGRLGPSAAEGIASVQLEKLMARGAIKPSPTKGLSEWFEVDPELL